MGSGKWSADNNYSFREILLNTMPSINTINDEKSKTEQKFLDGNQYSRNGITRYEEIFGKTFVSVGGETTTREFVELLDLKPGMKVLDIGSGAGGSAFFMARNYGVDVHGIDLSTNMNAISLEYRLQMEPEVKHRCNFYIEDADKMEFPENFFDVVYSRDTIMHFKDKEREKLYKNILKTLKPGGKLMISDYCRGEKQSPQVFLDYEKQRGYNLHTVKAYGKTLEKTGFSKVVALDKTNLMVNIMKMELKKFYEIKDSYIKKFSQKDFDDIEGGWKEKLVWCPGGIMAWGLFIATK